LEPGVVRIAMIIQRVDRARRLHRLAVDVSKNLLRALQALVKVNLYRRRFMAQRLIVAQCHFDSQAPVLSVIDQHGGAHGNV